MQFVNYTPNWSVGASVSDILSVSGATGSVAYSVSGGTIPDGLTLSPSGLIAGVPATAGQIDFTVTARDSIGDTSVLRIQGSVVDPNAPAPAQPVTIFNHIADIVDTVAADISAVEAKIVPAEQIASMVASAVANVASSAVANVASSGNPLPALLWTGENLVERYLAKRGN
ncbi:Ig domain-containing protein [Methylocystis heyeri]|uniref:Dystroglycan-type cadherin-like domain-containing protein n=1 Tax=Methylocystis heyeri TaxID=391905 RepID=A0A6B8KD03_9HYPH|nr:Ig domain-containing protein [Methylocystis heyeri]QGM46116.1 hypothetical protein H2LOC_010655 [Methylocystis heyeri]